MTKHGVEFLVIGGQAEYLFGSPRITYDVDLCYRRTPENLERLAAALRELKPRLRGAPPGLPLILDARALGLGGNYTFETDFGDVDLIGYVEPLGDFESLIKNAETYRVGDLTLKAIALEDLIRVKRHLGRLKDQSSLLQLEAIQRIRAEQSRE
jgi:predicted nucleotidyltransferase